MHAGYRKYDEWKSREKKELKIKKILDI